MQELNADQWRERLLYIATDLLKSPTDRPLTEEEAPLFCKAALTLAEMIVILDEKLCQGFVPPRAWFKEVAEPGQLPSSPLHNNLKSEAESITMKLMQVIENHVKPTSNKTALKLMEGLGKLLSVLSLFTAESVRIACINNIKPEAEPSPRLSLVVDADPTKEN